jgi:cardiolipin synthase
VSDKLDGLIARARRQQTELGAFLDPLADKFMLMSSFVAFWAFGLIPPWLAILVLSRDIIITTGWLTLRLLGHIRRAEPSMVGKLAVASQFALLVAVLLNINYGLLEALEAPLQWAVAALTGASGLQYINRGLKASHEEGRDNRRGP